MCVRAPRPQEHSPRWTHIAKLLSEATNQERTAASVRNYYKRFCASKEMANSITTKKLNRCQMCGQVKRGHICQPSALTYAPPAPPATPATQSTETAEPASAPSLLLNLQSSGEEEMPPLAPASLAAASLPEILTPGTPTLSALNTSGPLTAGPLSVSGFWKTGSPGSLGTSRAPSPPLSCEAQPVLAASVVCA